MLNFILLLLLTTVNARRDIFEWIIKNENFVSDSIELRRNKDYRGVFSKKFIGKNESLMIIYPENLIIYGDEWRDWERLNKKISDIVNINQKKVLFYISERMKKFMP